MRILSVLLIPLLSLAACAPSLEEVRQAPLGFTESVNAPWDHAGACLAKIYANEWDVSYIPTPSARTAELVVSFPAVLLTPKQPMYVFEITGGSPTVVNFRRRTFAAGAEKAERQARERVAQCGSS